MGDQAKFQTAEPAVYDERQKNCIEPLDVKHERVRIYRQITHNLCSTCNRAYIFSSISKIYLSNSATSRLVFLIFALSPSKLVGENQDQVFDIPSQKVQSLSWISDLPFRLHPRGVLDLEMRIL